MQCLTGGCLGPESQATLKGTGDIKFTLGEELLVYSQRLDLRGEGEF